jgi:hypothetical protein
MGYTPTHTNRNSYAITSKAGIRRATLSIKRRDGSLYEFNFDPDRLPEVRRYRWHVVPSPYGSVYAVSDYQKSVTLHRLIAHTPDGQECSFVNHDWHDCTSSNLRNGDHHVTMSGGRRAKGPKSGYSNIHWSKDDHRWLVRWKRGGKMCHLGSFETLKAAVQARDEYLDARPEFRAIR